MHNDNNYDDYLAITIAGLFLWNRQGKNKTNKSTFLHTQSCKHYFFICKSLYKNRPCLNNLHVSIEMTLTFDPMSSKWAWSTERNILVKYDDFYRIKKVFWKVWNHNITYLELSVSLRHCFKFVLGILFCSLSHL